METGINTVCDLMSSPGVGKQTKLTPSTEPWLDPGQLTEWQPLSQNLSAWVAKDTYKLLFPKESPSLPLVQGAVLIPTLTSFPESILGCS